MISPVVIESEIPGDSSFQVSNILISLEIYIFILQASPEPFNINIVPPSTLTIHTDFHVNVLQDLDKSVRCELTSLICIEDGMFSASLKSPILQ